eukprot:SAG22_NODE_3869_length_1488_cov_2.057595_1_plen_177_part_00
MRDARACKRKPAGSALTSLPPTTHTSRVDAGLMRPDVNPSKVLPIDFLPDIFRHIGCEDHDHDHGSDGHSHDHEYGHGGDGTHGRHGDDGGGEAAADEGRRRLQQFYRGFPAFSADLIPLKVQKDYSSGYRTAEEVRFNSYCPAGIDRLQPWTDTSSEPPLDLRPCLLTGVPLPWQ